MLTRFQLVPICMVLAGTLAEVRAEDRVPYFVREWGPEGSGTGQLAFPFGITHDHDGNLLIADTRNRRIQVYDIDGNYLRGWPLALPPTTQSPGPSSIAVASNGDIYVVDPGTRGVQRYSAAGALLGSWGQEGTDPEDMFSPISLALDAQDKVYVSDPGSSAIKIYTSTGAYITSWVDGQNGAELSQPFGITISNDGYAYVTDIAVDKETVQKFTLAGQLVTRWGSYGTIVTQFKTPLGTALDRNGDLWVIDHHNFRIQKFTADGEFLCVFGERGREDGQFVDPISITITNQGDMFITDMTNDGMVQHFRIPDGTAVQSTSWSQFKTLFRVGDDNVPPAAHP